MTENFYEQKLRASHVTFPMGIEAKLTAFDTTMIVVSLVSRVCAFSRFRFHECALERNSVSAAGNPRLFFVISHLFTYAKD
jgi:hypothetical protein